MISNTQKKTVEDREVIWKKWSEKVVLTLFGPVMVRRHIYQESRGGRCYIPMDEEWGVRDYSACPRVRESCLFGSGLMAPGELVKLLCKSSLFAPSQTAVRNMIEKHARAMSESGTADKIMEKLVREDQPQSATKIFVAGMDGATVLMRKEDEEQSQRPPRKGQSPSNHRIAMVGALGHYDIEQIQDEHTGETSLRPKRLSGDYFARMPEEGCASFKADFEFRCYESTQNLPDDVVKILLMDGARWQWTHVNGEEQFDGYEKLLDYWHACEHLGTAAEILFARDAKARKAWREKWKRKLKTLDDAVPRLLRSIRHHLAALGRKATDDIQKEVTYFENNAALMDYARFRRNGWPIGSGPVEAACKTIIKQRMCCSGMRWTYDGGQAVLDIRSVIKSDRWEPFWEQARKAA